MPDVPNFAKQHFEHFQRSNGHRSTGETLLYQAGSSLGPEFPANSGHPNRRLNVKYPRSFNRETTHQQRTMTWSTLRPSWSLSFTSWDAEKVPMSFLLKFFFMSFLCEALALYLIPCHEILHIVQHLHLGPWPMDDGMFLKLVLVRCRIEYLHFVLDRFSICLTQTSNNPSRTKEWRFSACPVRPIAVWQSIHQLGSQGAS